MLRASDLTAKELAVLLYGLEQLDDSLRQDSEFSEEFDQYVYDLRIEFINEYEKRQLHYSMFEDKK